MPLPNRVHPSGRLERNAARGTFMGNRGGRIHDPSSQRPKRGQPWASRRWISCVLQFKDRQRTVWGQGYTEVFFLDEVTALAAGHRPCFECRRANALAFQQALHDGFQHIAGWTTKPGADAMDRCLHMARTTRATKTADLDALPIGAMVEQDDRVFALSRRGLLPWTFDGYGDPLPTTRDGLWVVLTPQPIVAALRAGYRPVWHESAS